MRAAGRNAATALLVVLCASCAVVWGFDDLNGSAKNSDGGTADGAGDDASGDDALAGDDGSTDSHVTRDASDSGGSGSDGAADSAGIDSSTGGDPVTCDTNRCPVSRACMTTGVLSSSTGAMCCGGPSGACANEHTDQLGTSVVDCAASGTCSEAEARCMCAARGLSNCDYITAAGCANQAICGTLGSTCTCWGFAGGVKCKESSYSPGPCSTCPSNGWQ